VKSGSARLFIFYPKLLVRLFSKENEKIDHFSHGKIFFFEISSLSLFFLPVHLSFIITLFFFGTFSRTFLSAQQTSSSSGGGGGGGGGTIPVPGIKFT